LKLNIYILLQRLICSKIDIKSILMTIIKIDF